MDRRESISAFLAKKWKIQPSEVILPEAQWLFINLHLCLSWCYFYSRAWDLSIFIVTMTSFSPSVICKVLFFQLLSLHFHLIIVASSLQASFARTDIY